MHRLHALIPSEYPLLQAPMAGYTNFAFREMVRAYGGAGLQATEMISAKLGKAPASSLARAGGFPA